MPKALTAQSVERLKPNAAKRLEIPDGLLVGLYFIIQPSGARSWAVRYRHAGKPCKLTLGPYPALDLGTARTRARDALQKVAEGQDPAAEKREAAQKTNDGEPSKDLVTVQLDSFLERHVRTKGRARYAGEVERLLNREVRPVWGERRVQDVTRRDVIELLDALIDRGSPTTANRTFAAVRKFFNWLIERSVLDTSPCARVKPPAEEMSRDRILTDDEIRWLWKATERIGYPFGPFVRLLLLTGQRRDEVAKARHSEIKHRDLWTIPRERTKNGIAHDVPLSAATQEILAGMPRVFSKAGYLFTTTGESAISGYSVAKRRLDKRMLEEARREAEERGHNPEEVQIPEWRLHDLRRTLASGLARLGHAPHIIEAVLNHTSGTVSGVAAVYNRYSYADEKRQALEAWGQFVLGLADRAKSKAAVSLTAGARG